MAKHFKASGEITGVTALSPIDVCAFGASGIGPGLGTWHYNGRSWSKWQGNAVGLQIGRALSATNIWALGGTKSPFGSIMHYTGTWRPVTAGALTGLHFERIQALSATNVWATAFVAGGSQAVLSLVHFNGKWARYKLPWPLSPGQALASDGQGGVWLTATSGSGEVYFVHRTAKGVWSRTPVVNQVNGVVDGLAQIPGTSSLWSVGLQVTKTGGSAVIWADGAI